MQDTHERIATDGRNRPVQRRGPCCSLPIEEKKSRGRVGKQPRYQPPSRFDFFPLGYAPLTEREPRSVFLLTGGTDGTSRWVPRPEEVCLLAVRSALSVLVCAALELSRRSDSGTALKTKRRTADGRTHLTPHVVSVQRLSPNRTNESQVVHVMASEKALTFTGVFRSAW